jgi:hypothetical protein
VGDIHAIRVVKKVRRADEPEVPVQRCGPQNPAGVVAADNRTEGAVDVERSSGRRNVGLVVVRIGRRAHAARRAKERNAQDGQGEETLNDAVMFHGRTASSVPIIYPRGYSALAEGDTRDNPIHDERSARLGKAHYRGPVVLSCSTPPKPP